MGEVPLYIRTLDGEQATHVSELIPKVFYAIYTQEFVIAWLSNIFIN